jgi:hypothetical protein
MPYEVVKSEIPKGWFVVSPNGKQHSKKPFRTKAEAIAHRKALYANMPIRERKQMRQRKQQQVEGGVFNPITFIKERISGFTEGKRMDYTPSVRDYLKQNGLGRITNITIYRTPLQTAINLALAGISLNEFNEQMKKRGYDAMFHLFVKLTFDINGVRRFARLEKNEVIMLQEWNPKFETDQNAEKLNIAMNNQILNKDNGDGTFGLTIQSLLDNTRKKIGDSAFFMYDPFGGIDNKNGGNCQAFIYNVLDANGLLPDNKEARDFIYQDITGLDKQLPFTYKAAKAITDLGAKFDILKFGRGLDFTEHDLGY